MFGGMCWIVEVSMGLQQVVYSDMVRVHIANSWMNLGGMNGS